MNKKKTVLITGASRGMGACMVKQFQAKNMNVIGLSSSTPSTWESKPEEAYQVNLLDREEIKSFCKKIRDENKTIDILIHNAGLAGTNPMDLDSSDKMWDQILKINLDAPYALTKYLLPQIPKNSHSRIIMISSVLGLKGVPDQIAYCAAKHGVLGLMKSLAQFLAKDKITVNAICPGWTKTDMAYSRFSEMNVDEEWMKSGVPLGRFIEPEEIAKLCLYLASEESAMITAQSYVMDGGVLG